MKISTVFLFVFSIQLYCQSYFNVKFTDASYKYAEISNISSITFSGTEMTINLVVGSQTIETISTISEMTCDADILGGGSPFPVEMTTFYANVVENVVTLNWETATEVNNYGFDIERKNPPPPGGRAGLNPLQGGDFEKIGFVEGHGNSNSPKKYTYTDDLSLRTEKVLSGSFHYRLKQIDNDGSFEYSEIVTVELGTPEKFELKQNYPNPFNPSTKIEYSLPEAGFVSMKVYDILGKEVAALVNEEKKAGRYTVNFNGSESTSGIYFTRVISGTYSSLIKMILIK